MALKYNSGQHLPYYGAAAAPVTNDGDGGKIVDDSSSFIRARIVEDESGPLFRDAPFAILFILHFAVVMILGIIYGSWSRETDKNSVSFGDEEDATMMDYETQTESFYAKRMVVCMAIPCAVAAYAIASIFTATVLYSFTEAAVGACLVLSVVVSVATAALLCISYPTIYSFILSIAIVAISAFYAYTFWRFVGFAAANLKIAIKGVTSNWGIYILSLILSALCFVWLGFWLYVTNGMWNANVSADAMKNNSKSDDYESQTGRTFGGTMFLLLVSLYWTTAVILNTIQVTVAGVVGTWCLNEEEASGCSSSVVPSFFRASTFSFGSICCGSLLEAVVTALRIAAQQARENSENDNQPGCAILFCCLQCLLICIEDIIEYFNQWAYVLIGIYGTTYLESGKHVLELFKARGLTAVVSNDLAGYVLSFTAVMTGVCTGILGVFLEAIFCRDGVSYFFADSTGSKSIAFWICCFIGIAIASIMMNVVKGAVKTVIVCYADQPATFVNNHPKETNDMEVAWLRAFSDSGVREFSRNVPPYAIVV